MTIKVSTNIDQTKGPILHVYVKENSEKNQVEISKYLESDDDDDSKQYIHSKVDDSSSSSISSDENNTNNTTKHLSEIIKYASLLSDDDNNPNDTEMNGDSDSSMNFPGLPRRDDDSSNDSSNYSNRRKSYLIDNSQRIIIEKTEKSYMKLPSDVS